MAKVSFNKKKDFLDKIPKSDAKVMQDIFDLSNHWFIQHTSKPLLSTWPNSKQIELATSKSGVLEVIDNYKRVKDVKFNTAKLTITLPIGDQKVKIGSTRIEAEQVSADKMTRAQELGSAFVFRRAIKHNEKWATWEKLKQDRIVSSYLQKTWKQICGLDEVTNDWYKNFWKQNEVLLKKCSRGDFSQFEREGEFMSWITNYVRQNKWASKGKKDNWNPADIWIMNNRQRWIKVLEDATSTPRKGSYSPMASRVDIQLLQFNAIMRELFHKKQIWGISLKKVTADEAKWQEVNLHWNNDTKEKLGLNNLKAIEYQYRSTKCDCGRKRDKKGTITLATQDTKLEVKGDGSTTYKFQIKGNNSTGFGGLKYEPTDTTAGAARLGKATVEYVEDLFNSYNATTKFSGTYTDYPQDAEKFLDQEVKWKGVINRVDRAGVSLEVSQDEAFDNILFVFNTQPHISTSKLMQLSWLDSLFSVKQDQRNKFLTDMVFIAQKMGLRYGPFAKIY